MSKKTEEKIRWFVNPLNARSNKVIGDALSDKSLVDESPSFSTYSYMGKPLNLWRAEPEFIIQLLDSQKELGIKFRIFYISRYSTELVLWEKSQLLFKEGEKVRSKTDKGKVLSDLEGRIAFLMGKVADEFGEYQKSRRFDKLQDAEKSMKEINRLLKESQKETSTLAKALCLVNAARKRRKNKGK